MQNMIRRRSLGRLAAGAGLALAAPAAIGYAEPATLHIAQMQSLTGPSAPYGLRSRDGTLLAVDELNKTGVEIGGTTYKIVMPVDDMANDARQAVTLLRQYAADPSVVGVLGPTNSVGFLPVIPAAAQLEIPVVGNGAGAPVKEWNPWVFRVNLVSSVATPVMLQKLKASLGFKKLGVLYDQTQDSQRGDADICKAEAGRIGYDIAGFEAFRANDQDFSAQISTIRAAKPDAIWVAAATGDGVRAVAQLRDAGLEQPLLTGNGSFQDPVYWDGTKGQVIGCYCWIGLDLSNPAPELKNFATNFRAKFGQDPIAFCDYGASSVTALVTALQKAGKVDRHAAREVLASLDITTPTGSRVTFKNPPTGENLKAIVYVAKITGRGTYSLA